MRMSPDTPSGELRLAPASPPSGRPPARPAASPAMPARGLDSVELSASALAKARASKLVAAGVPGKADAAATAPAHGLPMQKAAAERNAAATRVEAGRRLDVQG